MVLMSYHPFPQLQSSKGTLGAGDRPCAAGLLLALVPWRTSLTARAGPCL